MDKKSIERTWLIKRTSWLIIFLLVCLVAVSGQSISNTRNAKVYLNADFHQRYFVSSYLPSIGKLSPGAVAQAETDQWTNLGPGGDNIFSLALDPGDPNRIFAGTPSGVYKSTNGGANWRASNSGLPSGFVDSLIIDPDNTNIIYAGSDGGGAYKSTNAGSNWTPINNGLSNPRVVTLAISPNNKSILYAGTVSPSDDIKGGVYKSTDEGNSWRPLSLRLDIFVLAIDPVNANTIYAGTFSNGVYKSTDGGTSWNASSTGLGNNIRALKIDPKNPNILYAGAGDPYKSTDAGASWSVINRGLSLGSVFALAIDPANSNTIYCGLFGFSGGVHQSTDGGATWRGGLLIDVDVRALEINSADPNTLFAGTVRGVYKSASPGVGLSPSTIGLGGYETSSLVISLNNNNFMYAATLFGVYKSSDKGSTWIASSKGSFSVLAIDPNNSFTIYGGSFYGLYKSTDAGDSWQATPLQQEIRQLVVTADNIIYVASRNGVYKSLNGGASWTAINSGLTDTGIYSIAVEPFNSNTVYAGTTVGGIFKTTDGGTNWFAINSGFQSPFVPSIAIDPANTNTLYAATGGYGYGVYKSTNGGASWSIMNTGFPSVTAGLIVNTLSIDKNNPRTIYAATSKGVYRSTNAGADWAIFGIGLSDHSVNSVTINPLDSSEIYAATHGGVYGIQTTGCTYTLSTQAVTIASAGETGNVSVTTQSQCNWQAISNANWIIVTSSPNFSGSGTVSYRVTPNLDSFSRTASLTIAGQNLTITQSGTGGGDDCIPTPIAFGQSINGALTNSSCLSPVRFRLTKRFSFTGFAGQQISIQLNSADFDSYLYLLDASGNILAQDENGGGNLNSRIPATGLLTLPFSGTFTIEVTSSHGTGTGNFTLTLNGIQIIGITREGKNLVIGGAGFREGATVYRNGIKLKKTLVEMGNRIICRKAFNSTSPGDTFKVINTDGTQSNESVFQ